MRSSLYAVRGFVIGPLVALVLATGCSTKKNPTLEYMPDMSYGPRVGAQTEDPLRPGQPSMRMP
ncbi:MAG: hypothetical protein AAB011_13910, partial [Candidatus Eisenbacteria bacterium]